MCLFNKHMGNNGRKGMFDVIRVLQIARSAEENVVQLSLRVWMRAHCI